MPNNNQTHTRNQNPQSQHQNRAGNQIRDYGNSMSQNTMSQANAGSRMQREHAEQQSRDSQGRFTDDQQRDAQGRFTDDNTNAVQASRSGEDSRQRDAQGRFTDEDGTSGRTSASRGNNDNQPRDSQGRFKDEDGSSSRKH